jgi:RimJ/RimL family protein N-acetyltransferase
VQQIGMARPGTYPDRLPEDVLARRAQLSVKPAPVVLTGTKVELRPIDLPADVEGLHAVTSGAPFALGDRRVEAYDADELVWKWMKGRTFRDADQLRDHLAPLANEPDVLMLTVRDRPTGHPLGIACYMANRPADLKVELGSIWYGPIAQGTGASREATQLMLAHAFELGYRRVEWKCDVLNERSRRSALSYGFTFEGVQRAHMIVKGHSRDTAWFALLVEDWENRDRA